MTIALVGGAGFVGTRLAKLLEDKEISYKIFDKSLSDSKYIDITKPETFGVLNGVTALINLAAEHRDDVTPKDLYDKVNVEGSRNLCKYCDENDIRDIIFISSVAVYGFVSKETDESGEINYFNDYGRTKYLAEQVHHEWYQENMTRKNLVIIRPTVIFGEGNRGNVYNLIKQISGGRFIMFGDGKNKKSMAYVQNVASFIAHSTTLRGFHLYNYVDKPDLDMNSLIIIIRNTLFDRDSVGIRLPKWLGLVGGYSFDVLAFFLRRSLPVSAIRVKKFLGVTLFGTSVGRSGFQAEVSLEQGLINTLNYDFKTHKKNEHDQ